MAALKEDLTVDVASVQTVGAELVQKVNEQGIFETMQTGDSFETVFLGARKSWVYTVTFSPVSPDTLSVLPMMWFPMDLL